MSRLRTDRWRGRGVWSAVAVAAAVAALAALPAGTTDLTAAATATATPTPTPTATAITADPPLDRRVPERAGHAQAVVHGANVACPDPIDNPPYPNASELEAPPVEQLGGLVRCTTVTRTYAGAGSWHVQEMQLATSDLGSFLVALHAPSTRPSGACGHGSPYTVPWFTLVTLDGSVLQPTVPFDGCIAAAAVLEAFDHLRWRTIAAVRYSQ